MGSVQLKCKTSRYAQTTYDGTVTINFSESQMQQLILGHRPPALDAYTKSILEQLWSQKTKIKVEINLPSPQNHFHSSLPPGRQIFHTNTKT